MRYRLLRFTNEHGFRVFEFEGIVNEHDPVRIEYSVRADLALVLKYGIPIQELPLLCCGVLERRIVEEHQREYTYTEADMLEYSQACLAAAHQQSKPQRKPNLETEQHQPTSKSQSDLPAMADRPGGSRSLPTKVACAAPYRRWYWRN